MAFERITAKKCTIHDISQGVFVKKEGFESSYVETPFGNIARANILGVVVNIEQGVLTIDDGSGKISARSFDPLAKVPELGDVVMVIGKPRVFNDQKFLVCEIIKKIENHKWIDYRKKELKARKKIQQATNHPKKLPIEPETEQEIKKEFFAKKQEKTPKADADAPSKQSTSEKIIEFIRQNDKGKGVSIALLEALDVEKFEKTLKALLANGEIYEVRAGFVKLLD